MTANQTKKTPTNLKEVVLELYSGAASYFFLKEV